MLSNYCVIFELRLLVLYQMKSISFKLPFNCRVICYRNYQLLNIFIKDSTESTSVCFIGFCMLIKCGGILELRLLVLYQMKSGILKITLQMFVLIVIFAFIMSNRPSSRFQLLGMGFLI